MFNVFPVTRDNFLNFLNIKFKKVCFVTYLWSYHIFVVMVIHIEFDPHLHLIGYVIDWRITLS